MGMVLMGGWAQGNLLKRRRHRCRFLSGPAPQDEQTALFDLNADCFIFWQKPKGAESPRPGQKLLATIGHEPVDVQDRCIRQITGSIPARTDIDLSTEGFTDRPARGSHTCADAVAKDRVVLSLAHNMAQSNGSPRR